MKQIKNSSQSTQPIYRYHVLQQDGMRYHFSTNSFLGQGWIFDGVAFHVPKQDGQNIVPLYQFHFDQKQSYGGWRFHFHQTMKPSQQGWKCDGIPFKVFNKQIDSTVPIYQYHIEQQDGWRFHFSFGQKPILQKWIKDQIAFYAYPGDVQ